MNSRIVFLDDNDDLRALLGKYLEIGLGVECSEFSNYHEFVAAEQTVLESRAAILDIELGYNQPSGIDAFHWLCDHGYQGKIFFFTGHGYSHSLVQQAQHIGVTIWEKPMGGQEMVSVLREVVFNEEQRHENFC